MAADIPGRSRRERLSRRRVGEMALQFTCSRPSMARLKEGSEGSKGSVAGVLQHRVEAHAIGENGVRHVRQIAEDMEVLRYVRRYKSLWGLGLGKFSGYCRETNGEFVSRNCGNCSTIFMVLAFGICRRVRLFAGWNWKCLLYTANTIGDYLGSDSFEGFRITRPPGSRPLNHPAASPAAANPPPPNPAMPIIGTMTISIQIRFIKSLSPIIHAMARQMP